MQRVLESESIGIRYISFTGSHTSEWKPYALVVNDNKSICSALDLEYLINTIILLLAWQRFFDCFILLDLIVATGESFRESPKLVGVELHLRFTILFLFVFTGAFHLFYFEDVNNQNFIMLHNLTLYKVKDVCSLFSAV